MKSYQPAAGWVLLQAEELAEQTASGIIKPQSALDKERAIGGETAPAFRVLKTGKAAFGPTDDQAIRYPGVGTKVFVLNKPMSIVVVEAKAHILFVNMDAVVGSVVEENA